MSSQLTSCRCHCRYKANAISTLDRCKSVARIWLTIKTPSINASVRTVATPCHTALPPVPSPPFLPLAICARSRWSFDRLIGRLGRLIYARFVSPHRPFANPNHIIASELHLTMPWGPTRRDAARRGLTCSSTAHKLATQDRERLPASPVDRRPLLGLSLLCCNPK